MNQLIQDIAGTNWEDEPNELIQPATHEFKDYSNEGSEFLDDAIRMVEQPLKRTEESIALGCPEDLL